MGGYVRQCLISSNASSQSLLHPITLALFNVRKKGLNLFINRAMKHPSAAKQPVRHCSFLLQLGADASMTALIWFGLTSISLCVTMNPKNLPALTPKAHLVGLSFMLYPLIKIKISSKCWACSLLVLLFTTKSSIYTSTMHSISGLKIFFINL